MFERRFMLQGLSAVLTAESKAGLSEINLTVLPFASSFHAPKARLVLGTKRGDDTTQYDNTLQLSSHRFDGLSAQAFLAAATVASQQMMQWEALSRSLSDPNDAAYSITDLAEQGRWEDVMLFIALLPDVLAPLNSRSNYNFQGMKATNLAAALLRHDAFGVAKETTVQFLKPGNETELTDLDKPVQNMVRAILTLVNRLPLSSSRESEGTLIAILLLERDDIPNYVRQLASHAARFTPPDEGSAHPADPDAPMPCLVVGNDDNKLPPANVLAILMKNRPNRT